LPIDESQSMHTNSSPNTNERNPSIFSFPEHDTPKSQQSDQIIDHADRIRIQTDLFVDTILRNAQQIYLRVALQGR
jgi:hypothetical protein